MTIEFNCPQCGALIAFESQHAGRRARCLSCGQKFIIPAESFQKAEKITPEPEPKGDPLPDPESSKMGAGIPRFWDAKEIR